MLVTLDTNVLYQALYSNLGASHLILHKVRSRQIQMALSVSVFTEYEAVLKRKKSLNDFELDNNDIDKFLRFVAYISKTYNPYYLFRPNLNDENDNIFIELEVTSQSDFLITNNIKDFRNSELKFDNLKIVSPAEFIKSWRKKYG